ncbi:hypothetical protein [Roseovarius sp. MMSF_3350]|uniref:hypothetical protein n=1 Tax=Roseovarius sp. MMSF_3350 TaxID=3046706 RepID=UPI00273E6606|nr:hypothetical protein [Roseovarius sp. MMSF_3350]
MSDQYYRKTCTYPGCTAVGKYANNRCLRHRFRVAPKEGRRVVQVERYAPGSSYAEQTHKMDVSLPAEPWEVTNV